MSDLLVCFQEPFATYLYVCVLGHFVTDLLVNVFRSHLPLTSCTCREASLTMQIEHSTV